MPRPPDGTLLQRLAGRPANPTNPAVASRQDDAEDAVSIKRESLVAVKELLLAQKALQRELDRRWSTMLQQQDASLAAGVDSNFDTLDTLLSISTKGGDKQTDRQDVTTDSTVGPPSDESEQTGQHGIIREMKDEIEELARKAKHGKVADLVRELSRVEPDEPVIDERPLWIRAVCSDRFDLFIGAIIVLNTLLMLTQGEVKGYAIKEELFGDCDGGPPCELDDDQKGNHKVFMMLEYAFCIIFALEVILRVAAEGLRFFYSLLHLADMVIVLISVVDLCILAPMNQNSSSGLAILRVVRLAKLAKVFRVVRVLRAFKPLRILVNTIAHSVSALAWSMILLFVCETIGAIFFNQLLHSYIDDPTNSLEMRQKVWKSFGTWSRSMYTAYEITMAPGGFIQYREVLENVSPLLALFFIVYVCTVTFAVIRVITALFLRATLSACDQDDNDEAKMVLKKRNEFAATLKATIDEDGSGGLGPEEFEFLLAAPEMVDWLADAGLSKAAAHRIFQSLMDAETGDMNLDDFLGALSRMSGTACASDVLLTSLEMQGVLSMTTSIVESMKHLTASVRHLERRN